MPGGAIAASRSRPATIVHGRRVPGSIPVRVNASAGPRSWAISPLCGAHRHRLGNAGQPRHCRGGRGCVLHPDAARQRRVGRGHAHVEAKAVEQVAERHHEAARQQQHVEQQGADRSDPENPQRGSAGLSDEAARSERDGVHRRVCDSPSPLSNDQDEAKMAVTPRGTATAIDRRATPGVIRTNTSAVSYRH